MKKRKLIFTICLIVMLFASCNPTPPVEKVKVTFIDQKGNEISQLEVEKGKTVTPPAVEPTEEYTVHVWSLDKEGTKIFDFSTPITSDITIYSVWVKEKNKVTFIGLEGNELYQVEVDRGEIVTPPTLESTNEYSFNGWSLDKEGTKIFDFSTPITSDTTLYSLWIKNLVDTENKLVYQENTDGTLTVIGVTDPFIMICSIPEKYEGKTITIINDYAFSELSYLHVISIPSTITRIGECVFKSSSYIDSIIVAEENKNYKTIENVLYSKDETSIIQYPTGKSSGEYVIPNTVTNIGSGAFYGAHLSSVTIPDSVKTIGDRAFMYNDITEITLPDNLISIGEEAFGLCNNLTKIEIPASVEVIGLNAFYFCGSLGEIIVPLENKYYASENGVLFNKDMTKLINYPIRKIGSEYTVPDSVTSLEAYSFFSCTSLEKVTIPNSVTSIGDCAFYSCENLTEISIPPTLKSLGESVFENCENLTSIIIPDTVTSIEERAFYCSNITSIYIPKSVISIGNSAFGNCPNLSEITVSNDNKYYTTKDGVLFNKLMSKLICYPAGKDGSSYTVPESVTSLEPYAFQGVSLNSIILPKNLITIREGALGYNNGLSTITIPESVTNIEPKAFANSNNLEEILVDENNKKYSTKDGVLFNKNLTTLIYYPSSKPDAEYSVPSGVTTIKDYAFFGTPKLQKINIPASVTSIGKYAFYYYFNYALTEIIINKSEGSINGAPWGTRAKVTWQE